MTSMGSCMYSVMTLFGGMMIVGAGGKVLFVTNMAAMWLPSHGGNRSGGISPSAVADLAVEIGSCIQGAFNAVSEEGRNFAWAAGVWAVLQAFPVVDVGVDSAAVIGTGLNAAVGCATP